MLISCISLYDFLKCTLICIFLKHTHAICLFTHSQVFFCISMCNFAFNSLKVYNSFLSYNTIKKILVKIQMSSCFTSKMTLDVDFIMSLLHSILVFNENDISYFMMSLNMVKWRFLFLEHMKSKNFICEAAFRKTKHLL